MRCLSQLRGTGQEPSLALLELFAYGTYPDYKAAAATLPKLNPDQLKKIQCVPPPLSLSLSAHYAARHFLLGLLLRGFLG